ncbi:MAG: hypothetical protein ACP5UN_00710 [Candidatus Micrarchaeia archaeon]
MNNLKKESLIGNISKGLTNREKNIIVIIFLFVIMVAVYFYLSYITAPPTIVTGSGIESAISNCKSSPNYINCLDNLAAQTENASICNESVIPEYAKSKCIYNVALKTNNINECNEISKNSNYSINCYLNLTNKTKNVGICSALSMPYSGDCIYNLLNASNFSDITLCNKIQNQTYLAMCKDMYYFENAVNSKSDVLCSNMSNKTSYITMMSLLEMKNKNIISKQSSLNSTSYSDSIEFLNFTPRDYCYYDIANESNNPQICNNINVALYKNLCSSAFEKAPEAPNINFTAPNATAACANNKNSTMIAECNTLYLLNSAADTGNISTCNEINKTKYPGLADMCVYNVALKNMNESTCNLIENKTLENNCNNSILFTKNAIIQIDKLTSGINNLNNTYPNITEITGPITPNFST